MKRMLFVAMVYLVTVSAFGQCAPPVKCPREMVRYFLEWDVSGALLHPDGWLKAASFFRRYNDVQPGRLSFAVIGDDYSVDDASIQDGRADIYFGFRELGQIDSMLRWHPADPRVTKYAAVFHMILSDERSETGADGKITAHRIKPPQWLIDSGPPGLWVSTKTAIDYVSSERQKVTDPSVHNNADATLATLKRLVPGQQRQPQP